MKISARTFIFPALIGAMLILSCGARDAATDELYDLSGKWDFVRSDAEAPAPAGGGTAAKQTVEIPGTWGKALEKNNDHAAIIVLRKKITLPKHFADRLLVLYLGRVAIADEAYWNGVLIGGTGRIPAASNMLDYDFTWMYNRIYTIPARLVNRDGENILELRVFSHIVGGMNDRPAIYTNTYWDSYYWGNVLLPFIFSKSILVINFIIFLFLVTLISKDTRKKGLLYLISLVVSASIIILETLNIFHFSNGTRYAQLFMCMYLLADYSFVLAVQEIINIRFKIIPVILTILVFLSIILIMALPDAGTLLRFGGPPFLALIFAMILYAVVIFFIALYKDPRRFYPGLFIVIPVIVSAVYNNHYFLTGEVYRMPLSTMYHLPLFLLLFTYYYIFNLRDLEKERDSLIRSLMKKSQQLQQTLNRSRKEGAKTEPREAIHSLIDYLNNNFQETYDRKELAGKFSMNEFYMGQIFKKTTGATISNYINNKRIEAAMQLLKDTDGKIVDIAFHVGFDNLTYFHRIFKNQTGITPLEYRKRMKSQFFENEDFLSE